MLYIVLQVLPLDVGCVDGENVPQLPIDLWLS
jgi:hypothetical protein